MIYILVLAFIVVGLSGFFKVCKVRDIIPQCIQIAIVAALAYFNIKLSTIIFVLIIFPWWFMFIGYKEIFREIGNLINFVKEQIKDAHAEK